MANGEGPSTSPTREHEKGTKMAEIDMSWVTEYQVVDDTFEKRDAAEFEKFDI